MPNDAPVHAVEDNRDHHDSAVALGIEAAALWLSFPIGPKPPALSPQEQTKLLKDNVLPSLHLYEAEQLGSEARGSGFFKRNSGKGTLEEHIAAVNQDGEVVDHGRFRPGSKARALDAVCTPRGLTGPFFLYVARLEHPAKNHCRLIEAFDRFKSATRSTWRLVLAGGDWHGAAEIRGRLRASPFQGLGNWVSSTATPSALSLPIGMVAAR